jgi:hypothetical protein
MGQDASRPLSFRSVKGRFSLVEVSYVSYTDGTGFFAVKRDNPQPVPFGPSMRCFVGKHADDELIPLPLIENWMTRLGMTAQETSTFWAVRDLENLPIQENLNF